MIGSTLTNRSWIFISKWVCESLMTGPFHDENKIVADVTDRWSFIFCFCWNRTLQAWVGNDCECPLITLGVTLWMEGRFPSWLHPLSSFLDVSFLMSEWPWPAFWDALWKVRSIWERHNCFPSQLRKFPSERLMLLETVKSLCPYSCIPEDQLPGFERWCASAVKTIFTWRWVTVWWVGCNLSVSTHLFP